MKKQAYNPFLPLHEYIPDGEPHVFGDRVYHYGSHDREGGYTFCMENYVVYSAPVNDLTDWRYEGISYRADQDPAYPEMKYMYAPDVVQGNDGKYYLYYCMGGDYGYGGYTGPISVAVSENPSGPFSFLGNVKYPDGRIMKKYICFDPAVINDNGIIRVYYGTQYDYEERDDFKSNSRYLQEEVDMFGRSAEEILSYRSQKESCKSGNPKDPDSIMGAIMVVLEDDMLTVKEEPRHIIPYKVKGSTFEEHPFFEGPSMRKMGETYYFIYSSWQNHELCYATSLYPDRDFVFQGTIVSNGDVGYKGRKEKEKHNMTGTTHGSIVEIDKQWYVFYHRLTHKSDYSRQACAEKIYVDEDGKIPQVEITSCGLNPGPLQAEPGMVYPAVIACNLTNGRMPHGSNSIYQISFPNVTHSGEERFIAEVDHGTLIGYKYFNWRNVQGIRVIARRENDDNRVVYEGPLRLDERCTEEMEVLSQDLSSMEDRCILEISLSENGPKVGEIRLGDSGEWSSYEANIDLPEGIYPLYFTYSGKDKIQLKEIAFI